MAKILHLEHINISRKTIYLNNQGFPAGKSNWKVVSYIRPLCLEYNIVYEDGYTKPGGLISLNALYISPANPEIYGKDAWYAIGKDYIDNSSYISYALLNCNGEAIMGIHKEVIDAAHTAATEYFLIRK